MATALFVTPYDNKTSVKLAHIKYELIPYEGITSYWHLIKDGKKIGYIETNCCDLEMCNFLPDPHSHGYSNMWCIRFSNKFVYQDRISNGVNPEVLDIEDYHLTDLSRSLLAEATNHLHAPHS